MKNIDTSLQVMGQFQKALGLPDEFAVTGFKLDMERYEVPLVTVKMFLTTDQAARIGPLLAKYRLEPKDDHP